MSWSQFLNHLNNSTGFAHPSMSDSFDALSYCNLSQPIGDSKKDEKLVNKDVSEDIVPKK